MIRLMKPEDERPLRRLVMNYLRETYAQGGDFPPTLENAAGFVRYGIDGAAELDPCLVVDIDGAIAGFVIARGLVFPGMTTRDVTLRSWGSYMLPAHRGKGLVLQLFMVLGRLAKQKGYTRVLGFTHGTDYSDRALKVVDRLAGMKEVGKVLMWRLADPLVDDSPLAQVEAAAAVNGSLAPE